MTPGETAYLVLVIGAFGIFGLILLWESWKSGQS